MKAMKWLTRIGPAFVIAAVVLGPGSVTTMTKMGAVHGYAMLWLPLLAGVLMAGFVTLFMRFGIAADKSFLAHCAELWGRPFAALCGLAMFYAATAFQIGNNIGVTTAMNSLLTPAAPVAAQPSQPATAPAAQTTQPATRVAAQLGQAAAPIPAWVWPVVFNAMAITFLFAFRRIYSILERMMTALVAVMLVAFFINLFFARPSIAGIARGLVPSIPKGLDWMVAAGLVATTFSIVGAIFQTYLVRARGWRQADFGKGVADSVSGIGMLTLISMVIMVTSAAVLHPGGLKIENAGDMAAQLQTFFGAAARVVFCVGFAAAAFSSFLVNAMIGGTLLSDGCGRGEDINSTPAKGASAACLLIGMAVAVPVTYFKTIDFTQALVAVQAGTLLAIPLVILAALLVLLCPQKAGVKRLGPGGVVFVLLGLAVLVAIAVRSYATTFASLRKMFGG
jgi:Mn2+/Fe2+ NRAMP family transporter